MALPKWKRSERAVSRGLARNSAEASESDNKEAGHKREQDSVDAWHDKNVTNGPLPVMGI